MRRSGVLLPIFSIPSKYGIGTFSKEAYDFVDFLKKSSQKLWQILPLGPTGFGDSPYQSYSTFAGNPYFVDLEAFIHKGWLTEKECAVYKFPEDTHKVHYEDIEASRQRLFKQAYANAIKDGFDKNVSFLAFNKENEFWLNDYALFMTLKEEFSGLPFNLWDEDIKLHKDHAVKTYAELYHEKVTYFKFLQYFFYKQWMALKKYANKKGIEIVGDIPIYVAFDSADTWSNPKLFQLRDDCTPIAVAGCPPDAFSETGQLWGNPLYNWSYHKQTEYAWWMSRIGYCYKLYDIVRIDHFRGFDEYWSVPYGDCTAENGKWCKGPGYALFDTMEKKLGEKQIIAEDLGYLTDSVIALVKKTGFPGMKILQFAFHEKDHSAYLPYQYEKNCVVYTGTHDNDTTLGWYSTLSSEDKRFLLRYLGLKSDKKIVWELIRSAISSVADTAIIPMQDYLKLDSSGRINTPSTVGTNWNFRMKDHAYNDKLAKKIKKMTKLYGR